MKLKIFLWKAGRRMGQQGPGQGRVGEVEGQKVGRGNGGGGAGVKKD